MYKLDFTVILISLESSLYLSSKNHTVIDKCDWMILSVPWNNQRLQIASVRLRKWWRLCQSMNRIETAIDSGIPHSKHRLSNYVTTSNTY